MHTQVRERQEVFENLNQELLKELPTGGRIILEDTSL